MRTLNLTEINQISGAGVPAAVAAFPAAVVMGTGATALAIATSPLVAYQQGDGFFDGLEKAIFHSTLGIQMGCHIVNKAYNW